MYTLRFEQYDFLSPRAPSVRRGNKSPLFARRFLNTLKRVTYGTRARRIKRVVHVLPFSDMTPPPICARTNRRRLDRSLWTARFSSRSRFFRSYRFQRNTVARCRLPPPTVAIPAPVFFRFYHSFGFLYEISRRWMVGTFLGHFSSYTRATFLRENRAFSNPTILFERFTALMERSPDYGGTILFHRKISASRNARN